MGSGQLAVVCHREGRIWFGEEVVHQTLTKDPGGGRIASYSLDLS
jgi:hypothetical protein